MLTVSVNSYCVNWQPSAASFSLHSTLDFVCTQEVSGKQVALGTYQTALSTDCPLDVLFYATRRILEVLATTPTERVGERLQLLSWMTSEILVENEVCCLRQQRSSKLQKSAR